jgi:death-on-curing family protein
MIINNIQELNTAVNSLIEINKAITGRGIVIKKNELSSIFSGYPYIDDIKTDIATIVYNIMENHVFDDGNKRTALVVLVSLSDKYNLILRPNDDELYEILIERLVHDTNDQEFINKLW